MFENDYRNGIRWWQFDPTKWVIKGGEYIGLTSKLRVSPEDKIEKAKLAMMLKRSQQKITMRDDAELMLEKLQAEYDALIHKLNDVYEARKKLVLMKKK